MYLTASLVEKFSDVISHSEYKHIKYNVSFVIKKTTTHLYFKYLELLISDFEIMSDRGQCLVK